MKMHAPAHRRDELVPARRAHTAPAAPTLQLASLIGNQAMRRLITAPVVQRSFWDEVTEASEGVSDWFGGGEETALPAEAEAPVQEPEANDYAPELPNNPGFDDLTPPQDIREEAGAEDAAGEGSWFEQWFGEQEAEQTQAEEAAPSSTYIEPEAEATDECAALEAEISRLSEYIQELYDRSQAMLPELESLKAQAEALERSKPGSAEAAEARQRYEAMHHQYNQIVDECLYLMQMRDQLRQQLEDCRNRQKNKMPKNLPVS